MHSTYDYDEELSVSFEDLSSEAVNVWTSSGHDSRRQVVRTRSARVRSRNYGDQQHPLRRTACHPTHHRAHDQGGPVSFLKKMFGREDDKGEVDVPITLDAERRLGQLSRLEQALDALAREMRQGQSMDNPGWRARVNEYSRLAGEAMSLRQAPLSRDALLDLVFEVRPVFSGSIPEGMEQIGPLQDEVIAAADELQQLLPGERG